jgi:phospholipase/carboxylesterase
MNRRGFFSSIAGVTLCGCVSQAQSEASVRVRARLGKAVTPIGPGTHSLGIRQERDAVLYVPKSVNAEVASPLLVYLHGAGGPRQSETQRMTAAADEHGVILLSPSSIDATWDAIRGSYGADVRVIDEALARTFVSCKVDARRIGCSGFSDGASYTLGFGLSNGDLFKSVLAFSPGFIPSGSKPGGKPRLFVSHGTSDTILPIDSCSRVMVPQFKRDGYNVTYREFDGPHTVPPAILGDAMKWFLEG